MNAPLSYFIPPSNDRSHISRWLIFRDVDDAPSRGPSWGRCHARIVVLGRQRAKHEHELCRMLVEAEQMGVSTRAGFASMREYAARFVGLSARQTEERLRVGRLLPDLPALDRALAAGDLCWSKVRELTRVVTAETDADWVRWAADRSAGEVEKSVARRHRGDRPTSKPDPQLVKHRLRFEVSPETMALVRDLQARVRADIGDGPFDDDVLLQEMVRRALGGASDEGRANYQVAVSRCDDCGQTSIDAGGHSEPIDDVVAETFSCDAQVLPPSSPQVGAPPPPRRATQTIPPATRRRVMRRDKGRCVVPGCRNHVFIDVHHLVPKSEGGSHDDDNLICACGAHHARIHAGHLRAEGTPSTGLRFRHTDGSAYGKLAAARPPDDDLQRLDTSEQARRALVGMGFRSKRARQLIDKASHPQRPASVRDLIAGALVLS